MEIELQELSDILHSLVKFNFYLFSIIDLILFFEKKYINHLIWNKKLQEFNFLSNFYLK